MFQMAADVTDMSTFFSQITDWASGTAVPAILVALGAISVAVLVIIGVKVGFKSLVGFFKSGAKGGN